ncbi:MAG: phosphate signaling complex protein PhoU [Deltaproteobacteria bacterium]|nr:phosphate signaling complex protein PhoU [Deltaproteobacteria bacterium]
MDQHIDHYFDEALASLKQQILLMGSKVEVMLSDCVLALKQRDVKMASAVIEADHSVNALEVSIDEQCIQLLARYQPAAGDLRFITRGLKIVTDLERIGDLAVNMAQRITDILTQGSVPLDLTHGAGLVQQMLKESLDAFVNGDVAMAEKVLQGDDMVDDLTEQFVEQLFGLVENESKNYRICFSTASIVKYLERIADHSTNIAELTIFMVKGRDIRHGKPH